MASLAEAWPMEVGEVLVREVIAEVTDTSSSPHMGPLQNLESGPIEDMRITGGTDFGVLGWFVDQTRDILPRPGVLSVSLWWYKLAMLAWALWLSFALTRWLKWAWEVFVRDGLWRSQPAGPPRASRSAEET